MARISKVQEENPSPKGPTLVKWGISKHTSIGWGISFDTANPLSGRG